MSNTETGFEIAIIGLSGRFPGADTIAEFWQNLKNGVESISFFSDEELAAEGIDHEIMRHPNYVRAKGVLNNIEYFDAPFFGFTPREAQIMDPQHRLFLQCAWEALENAGYDAETYRGAIGIYASVSMNYYLQNNLFSNRDLLEKVGELQKVLSSDKDFLSTRVAYKMNLRGPAVVVQSACSSSLVSTHLACQSLISGESDMALAGGVSVVVPQKTGYFYQEEGIASPDGHCRAFDANARGTVSGNGVGIVALKRLSDAIADGDHIYAVIKGSAINNDGALKVGYTAPGIDGQADVISRALTMAEVDPETIGCIEAHGTGTALGDPIEIAALTQAFQPHTNKKQFCAVGSVKTNVGHLDSAAGVTGLIKTVLALNHREIPPSLHFEHPNPEIDFDNGPFYVNNRLQPWQSNGGPRRAGVSSFGMGGTNAHVILEEAPVREPSSDSRPWQLVLVSAKTAKALDASTSNLKAYFKQNPALSLADLAHTLQVGRRAFDHRRMLICHDREDALSAIESGDSRKIFTATHEAVERPIAFMFPGQGAQHVNMAAELYHSEKSFREQVDRCSDLLQPLLDLDLRDVLYSGKDASEAAEQLQQTALAQPALFLIEYALARLWMSWGIQPQAMIGHSIGEYVAACLAGVFSLEDALKLVAVRGRLMQGMPAGEMLAVPKAVDEIEPYLNSKLSLAAINDPTVSVVSGAAEAIQDLEKQLNERGETCKRLHTSHAFHSAMMDPVLDKFVNEVKSISLSSPQIPFVSNVTGTWITAADATSPDYWARHLRQTVYFAKGIEALLHEPNRILLEVGPSRTLSGLATRHPAKTGAHQVFASLPHARDEQSDVAAVLTTLGRLWLTGVEVDWFGFYQNEQRHRLPLPTYPFETQRYWVDTKKEPETQAISAGKNADLSKWFYVPSWKRVAPLDALSNKALEKGTCWIVFLDECGLGNTLVERLQERQQNVIPVTSGNQFKRTNQGTYTINPKQKSDYDALLEEVLLEYGPPQKIVHLWNVTESDESGLDTFAQQQERGYYSLLYLAQSLGELGLSEELQLAVISNNLHEVTGEEQLTPEKSTLVAPCTVIPQEYSNIKCCNIDISRPQGDDIAKMRSLADILISECISTSAIHFVAYRGRHRWMRTFESVRLPHTEDPIPLRQEGSYLITGGLGAVGLVLSEYLARRVHGKLVLTGRIDPTTRQELRPWLLNAENGKRAVESTPENESIQFSLSDSVNEIEDVEKKTTSELAIKGINGYTGLEEKLNHLCASYLYRYLNDSGINTWPGQTYDRDELRKQLKILPKFERLYHFILNVLSEDGIIRIKDDHIEFMKSQEDITSPTVLDQELREKHPEFEGIYGFLEHCMDSYDKALSGEIEGVSVLFPGGSAELLINYHAKNREEPTNERVQIESLKRLLTDIIRKSDGKKVRILEVGAGNGVLTWSLVPSLQNMNVEYHFTDLVKSFVQSAEKEASQRGWDFMEFGELDIAKAPTEQGYEKYSFDIVLALNVVHATRSIEESIENLKTLLVPNGIMCFIEPVKSRRWMEMTWGLAKDWWAFEDTHLRQISPLMEMETWEEVLRSQGLPAVSTFPQLPEARKQADSGLIIAQQDAELATKDYRDWMTERNESKRERARMIVEQIKAIEQAGGEIVIDDADVSKEAEMQALVSQIDDRFGKLNGVIHLAGLTDPESFLPIPNSGLSDAEAHFQPKVYGAYVLENVLRDRELDFCVLFSSLAAVLGGLGLTAYSAANLFMDYFVHKLNRNSKFPWKSINWDGWGVREAQDDSSFGMSLTEYVMTPAEGLEAFQRALAATSLDQVAVSTGDLEPRIDRWLNLTFLKEQQTKPTEADAAIERPDLPNEYVAPDSKAEETIAGIWRSLFGIEQIGVDDDFFQLGGHSLLATQFLNELRKYYKSGLSFRSLFENPTIAELAKLVEGASDGQDGGGETPVKELLRDAVPSERAGIIQDYLSRQIAQLLGRETEEIKSDGKMPPSDMENISDDLLWNIKSDLHLPIPKNDIVNKTSVTEIAQAIVEELEALEKLHKMQSTVSLSDSDDRKSKKRGERRKSSRQDALPQIERTEDSEEMLPNLDDLSDEEVEELLNKMSPEKN